MSVKLHGSLHIKSDRAPSEVTSLGDIIYITIGSKIFLYEAGTPYQQLDKTIKLPGKRMIDSVEVSVCTVNECLYINDPDKDVIWKVNPGNDYQLTKWLSMPNPKEIYVSTSSRGEVFVLDRDHFRPTIDVYTPEAALHRSVPIRLSAAAYSILSAAVEIMPEVVAISFDFVDGYTQRKGIVVIRLNETGQVLREIGWTGLHNLTAHSLGRFIVAESSSSQILKLLDYQLYPVQVVSLSNESGDSRWPMRCLCYRKETRELIVDHLGNADGYQLDFYKLSYDEE